MERLMASILAKRCLDYALLLLTFGACPGCCVHQEQTCKALMREPTLLSREPPVQAYYLGCPDTLQVQSLKYPDVTGTYTVEPNGCISIASLEGLRVEGLTLEEAKEKLAELLHTEPLDLQITVSEYRHRQVYVFGEVSGLQSAIPYHGPESIIQLLQRAGGLTRNSAPDHVRLLRNSACPGEAPRVHQVDLQAILLQGDRTTDISVQPNDQIYVPESKQGHLSKCFHPCLQSLRHWVTEQTQKR